VQLQLQPQADSLIVLHMWNKTSKKRMEGSILFLRLPLV
jgi:hypothetical protein